MELKRTINCDKRYYIEEKHMENPVSFLETMRVFNDAKFQMYHVIYDQRFLNKGPLAESDMTFSKFLKPLYHLNDYYNAAIYTAASGQISSQKELRKYYNTTLTADIENRTRKIDSVVEELVKKKAVKDSIRTYAKSGKWIKPYPRCTMKVSGKKILLPGNKAIPIDEYERTMEAAIRNLKTRSALLKEGCRRKEIRLERNNELPPKRMIFGGRKLYAAKDSAKTVEEKDSWKTAFFEKRHQSMSLPGRHTSKYGNFLCKFDGTDLHVICMDGTETIFHNFKLTRYQDAFLKNFSCDPKERQSLCYNFHLKRDKKGRQYLIVSVTMQLQSDENIYYGNGAVSMDINYDHFALTELDETGKLLDQKLIRFDLVGKSTGQISNILGQAVKEVFDWCAEKDKHLIKEDIDLTMKLASRKYGDRVGNHHMTLFAYQKIASCVENQALKRQVAFRKINPAYTSQIGKFLYMRKYGISIHQAAAYTIGLVGLNQYEKLTPDPRILDLLKDKEGNIPDIAEDTYRNIWKRITNSFAGVRKHCFYRKIPYDVLEQKKRPSLRTLAAEMKQRYMLAVYPI